MTLRASRHLLGLACAAAVVSTSGLAAANGRYPGADEFLVSPKSASTYVVHGSFGLLVSNDAGKKWSWICDDVIEPSLAGDSISPSVVVFESGAIAVSSPSGIRRSTDGGCSFAPAPGTEGRRIRDIAKERGTPRAVAITAPADGTPPEVLETTDDGVSWHKVGVSLPPELVPQNVELAQGAPSRLYASGTAQFSYDDAGLADAGIPGNRVGVMYASDDRGQTWRRTFVPEAYSIASDVYISAVDPANPDLVYARSGFQVSPTSRDAVVLVSRDGAKTYEVVFRANKASLPGFALSPDGSKIALGVIDANGDNGTWIASRDTMKFEKHAPDVLSCLTWGADSLFACQNLFTPACNPTCPYVVASSKNDAQTWDPLLVKLSDVDGPLACPQASPFTSMCIPVWENNWKCKLEGCDAAAPSDAGGGDAGEPGIPSGVVGPDGCSCGQTPGARAAGTGLSVIASALGLAAVVARLRRRR